jgi:phage/plasmid primase-like uncharacterized protein
MNFEISSKLFKISLVMAVVFLSFSCSKQQTTPSGGAQTPTEAYKMLFAAVKAKDTEKIKQMLSKDTQGLAGFLAERQKQTIEKVYENGFTATTLTDSQPQIRDERVKDNFGALEVYNQKEKRWEDLPFIYEDGGWRLAVGEVFKNTYKSPGKAQSQVEMEATNTSGNNVIQMMPNVNGKPPVVTNSNPTNQVPPTNKKR